MSSSRHAWVLFFTGIAMLISSSILGALRNPQGIPNSSPWNYVELGVVVIGLAISAAAPFVTGRSLAAKLGLSLAAVMSYFGILLTIVVIDFFIFGMPVQS